LGEAAQFAVTTVVGGTVSVIGGGKFANGAAQAGFGCLFNQAISALSPSSVDSGNGPRVTLVCRPVGSTPANHCGTFISSSGDPAKAEIEKQYSLAGGGTRFLPQDSSHSTFSADRAAFRAPGGRNLHYPIAPPADLTLRQFADNVIFWAEQYRAEIYLLFAGPNSNSAAAFPLYRAGAQVPNVPRAPALDYWKIE
jgi:hypothetical protein